MWTRLSVYSYSFKKPNLVINRQHKELGISSVASTRLVMTQHTAAAVILSGQIFLVLVVAGISSPRHHVRSNAITVL